MNTIMEIRHESSAAPQGPEGLEALKHRYLRHLGLKNFSPFTVRQQEQTLRFFIAYLGERGVKKVADVRPATVEGFKAHMMAHRTRAGLPLTANTIRGRLFVVFDWFRFLKKKGLVVRDPAVDVQAPSREHRLPTGIMSEEEVRQVMAQPDLKTLIGQRDRTLMDVLYSTGARAGEVLALRLPDIDLVKRVARIRHGKGDKERFVLLTGAAVKSIGRYLAVVRPPLAQGVRPTGNNWKAKFRTGGDLLFLSVYGGPMGRSWLAAIMSEYLKAAGIVRRVSPVHGFRHAVATHLLAHGMDIRYVQGFLGHASINSTTIYTHVERKPLKASVDRHHPRARRALGFRSWRPNYVR